MSLLFPKGKRMSEKLGREASATGVAAAKVPSRDGLLGLAVAVVVIAGLFLAKDVLIPITLAVLLSFVLSPIVLLLRRLKFPKGFAIFVAVMTALSVLGGIGTLVGMQAASLSDKAPSYVTTIQSKIDSATGFITSELPFIGPDTPPPAVIADPNIVRGTRTHPLNVRVIDPQDQCLFRHDPRGRAAGSSCG